MSDLTLYQWANLIKGFALAIGVAVAIAMVALWWLAALRARRIERQARARRIYADFLLQTMQHPEIAALASDEAGKLRFRSQYHWFLDYLITTAEEILLIDPAPLWREAFTRHLEPHREALAAAEFRDGAYRHLTAEIRALIDGVVLSAPASGAAASNVRQLKPPLR